MTDEPPHLIEAAKAIGRCLAQAEVMPRGGWMAAAKASFAIFERRAAAQTHELRPVARTFRLVDPETGATTEIVFRAHEIVFDGGNHTGLLADKLGDALHALAPGMFLRR